MKMGLGIGLTYPNKEKSLTQKAIDAIRRAGGTVLLSGLPRNYFDSSGTTPATVDNPVGLVLDATGTNNATQPTTGSKPTLRRGLVNQLLWSGDFTNAAWVKSGVTVTSGQADSSGGFSASRLQAAGGAYRYMYESAVWTAGQPATLAIRVKSYSGAAQAFRLTYGPTGSLFSPVFTADGNWQIFTVSFTSSSTDLCAVVSDANGAGASAFDLVVERFGLYQGTVTAQQILAAGGIPLTTTAPASSALGNYWWQFSPDAPGDFLQTAITTGNEGWLAVAYKQNAAVTVYPVASGGLIDTQAGICLRLTSGITPLVMASDGTLRQLLVADTNIAIGDLVVQSCGWSSTTLLLGVNNTEKSAARTRNPTSSIVTTIGGADGTGSGTVNGSISAVVRCPTLPPAADRALIRAWMAKQQGQTL